MQLAPDDAKLFFSLQSALNNFIYGQLQQAKGLAARTAFRDLPFEKQSEVREAFAKDHTLIDRFVAENPQNLGFAELEIVADWRNMKAGQFCIIKHLQKYSVFLEPTKTPTPYGVVGLTQPLTEILGPNLPLMVDAILLPFRDQITYDGVLNGYSVSFGPGLRKTFNTAYQQAKDRCGIVVSLGLSVTNKSTVIPKPRKRATKATPS
jgi:hypothetical protein